MSEPMLSIAEVRDALVHEPLGWQTSIEQRVWPPSTPHSAHKYDFRCAICQCGDHQDALLALVHRVLNLGRCTDEHAANGSSAEQPR